MIATMMLEMMVKKVVEMVVIHNNNYNDGYGHDDGDGHCNNNNNIIHMMGNDNSGDNGGDVDDGCGDGHCLYFDSITMSNIIIIIHRIVMTTVAIMVKMIQLMRQVTQQMEHDITYLLFETPCLLFLMQKSSLSNTRRCQE